LTAQEVIIKSLIRVNALKYCHCFAEY